MTTEIIRVPTEIVHGPHQPAGPHLPAARTADVLEAHGDCRDPSLSSDRHIGRGFTSPMGVRRGLDTVASGC